MRELATCGGANRNDPAVQRVVDGKDLWLPIDDDGNPAEAAPAEKFKALRLSDHFQLSLGLSSHRRSSSCIQAARRCDSEVGT
jgi:hypothetical protein